jgi:two-component system, NtrC family, sensor kinase
VSARVLFVDDEDNNLVVCEAVCADHFEVLTATSGEAALALMREQEVGVIIADQRMPGMSGVELLERVRIEFPDVVRLLITAYSDLPAAVDAINRGQIRRYLKKPWQPDELRAETADALEHYTMRRRVRELERRLSQTERVYARGIVAASIGHELRNPIGWVSTNVKHSLIELEALREVVRGTAAEQVCGARLEDLRSALQDAAVGAERVVEIVSAIRGTTVRPAADQELVNLEEVLRLGLRLVEGDLRRSARLDLEVRGAPRVRGSRTKLSQIVLNLLVNAVQAAARNKEREALVGARVALIGNVAELEIADTGMGVPEGEQDRIFDPFFTTKPGVGTGLGLAISRRIAEELGGFLEVGRDVRLGGAVFRLRLPAEIAGLVEKA